MAIRRGTPMDRQMATRMATRVRGDDFRCFSGPVLTPHNSDGKCDCNGPKSRTRVLDPARALNIVLTSKHSLETHCGALEVPLARITQIDPELLCSCAMTDATRDPCDIVSEQQERAADDFADALAERFSPTVERLLVMIFGRGA